MPYFKYNNQRVHYIDEGQGEVIVLLAGNTASSAVHKGEIEFFSKNFRVICPDYIGYGKSDRVDKFPYDFWWVNAKMVCELIKTIGVKECIVIGTSGGGNIALNIAIIKPDLIRGVIADSISGQFVTSQLVQSIVEDRKQKTKEQCMFWSYAHGEDWEQIIDLDTKMIQNASTKGESVFKDKLSDIKCPVLVTASLEENIIPDIEKEICGVARKVKSSKVIFYPQGNHPLMWSCPEVFRKESLKFMKELAEDKL